MIGEVLKLAQHIPIVERPYAYIAQRLGIKEQDVLNILKKAKEERIIRQISPIYDTKSLGYQSSLIAFKVNPERIEEVANFINTHPGVSHNYERTGYFNLWITLAVPPDAPLNLEETVRLFAKMAEDYAILRTKKVFKIGVKLGYDSVEEREDGITNYNSSAEVTEEEKVIISLTQDEFPLVDRPFSLYAERLGMDEVYLLEKFKKMNDSGVLRRIGAILYHRKVGYSANGMSVWRVEEEDKVNALGNLLASYKGVSHCYERTPSPPNWPYNLYAMIHGKSEEEVDELVKRVSEESGIKDYQILYSTREFKKTRVRYFTEEIYHWYDRYAR